MFSLGKLINDHDSRLTSSLLRLVHLTLQSLELHAVGVDETELIQFKASLRDLNGQITSKSTAESLLLVAGALGRTISEHGLRANRQLKAQQSELHSVIGMMASSLAGFTEDSSESVQELRRIERELEKATAAEDIRVLKERLSHCLVSLRKHTSRQVQRAAKASTANQSLKIALERAANPAAFADTVDDESAGRAAAEEAILASASDQKPKTALALRFDRLSAIERRFGHNYCDSILAEFVETIKKWLPATSEAYRWDRAGFLFLVESERDDLNMLRIKMAKAVEPYHEREIIYEGRTVSVSLGCNWTAMQLVKGKGNVALQQIRSFLGAKPTVPI